MTKTRPLRMTDDTYRRLRVATVQAGVTTGTLIGMALDALERIEVAKRALEHIDEVSQGGVESGIATQALNEIEEQKE